MDYMSARKSGIALTTPCLLRNRLTAILRDLDCT